MITKKKKNNLILRGKFNLIFRIYTKLLTKRKIKNKFKNKFFNKANYFNLIIKKIKKKNPKFLDKKSKKEMLKFYFDKIRKKKLNLKSVYKENNQFLTKRLRKILLQFNDVKKFDNTKNRIRRRLNVMNRLFLRKRMRRNLSKRTFFFKITRKSRRRKIKVLRINRTKPIFTKKIKKEKKFLLKARESLLKTKKYMYRKQFPKIKGKKNKNFNFFYYNNIDRAPFKFNIGRIVITYLINNTFINIHNSKKMLKVISAGKLGFKGPKRATPYSRQVVARKAISFVAKTRLNVLDIFLNSNYNRWYYFLFKEISKPKVKPYVIRYLVISNSRAHGFIRDKKHRRK